VDISIDGNNVIMRVGEKEIPLGNVDINKAASFRDKLVQMKQELYPEQT